MAGRWSKVGKLTGLKSAGMDVVPMEVDEEASATSFLGRIAATTMPTASGSGSSGGSPASGGSGKALLPPGPPPAPLGGWAGVDTKRPPPPPMPSVEKAESDVDDESIADLSTAATSDVASKKWLKRQRQKLAKSSGAAAAGPGGDFFLVTEAKLLEAKVGAKTGGEGGSSAWRLPAGVKPDPKAGKEEGMVLVHRGGGKDAMKKVAVQDTYSRGAYPNWPLVDCRGCGTDIKWRFAAEERVLTKRGTLGPRTLENDVDDEFALYYWCAACKAVDWGVDQKEAQLRIIRERPSYQRHQDQASRFKEADAKVAEAVPGMTKGERRSIAVKEMKAVLAPLVKFILLKRKVLLRQGEAVERFRGLEQKLAGLKSMEEAAEVMAEMEAVEDEIDACETPLAFAGRKNQFEWIRAADNSDEWTTVLRQ